MQTETRELAGISADIEKQLVKGLALARVLTFSLRNGQQEGIMRSKCDLTSVLYSASELLLHLRSKLVDA